MLEHNGVEGNTQRVWWGNLKEREREIGRHRRRWKDYIEASLKEVGLRH
jgi:DNA-directed RNA polymerase sigma subunit (sigma70/sigma32)